MIPRFDYSFSWSDGWESVKSLLRPSRSDNPFLSNLFPQATIAEISSARVGIKYALLACKLKPKARIGVQPYTCSSVMATIASLGYTPVFIDVDHSLTLNCADLSAKISGLDALIITHTFGYPADIRRLKEIVGDLPVIEDCAHAFLTSYENRQLGTFFDMAVFSFGYGKFPSLGDGGLLVVNNTRYAINLAPHLLSLKSPGVVKEITFISRKILFSILYSRVGYKILYSLFNQKIAVRGLAISEYPNKERVSYKSINHLLNKKSSILQTLALKQRRNALSVIHANQDSFHFIPTHLTNGGIFTIALLTESRDKLYNFLIEKGIGAGKHFQHALAWASAFGYQTGDCPIFEKLNDQILTIPCSYSLTENDINHINRTLEAYSKSAQPRVLISNV